MSFLKKLRLAVKESYQSDSFEILYAEEGMISGEKIKIFSPKGFLLGYFENEPGVRTSIFFKDLMSVKVIVWRNSDFSPVYITGEKDSQGIFTSKIDKIKYSIERTSVIDEKKLLQVNIPLVELQDAV